MDQLHKIVERAADSVRKRIDINIDSAVILGSGLADFKLSGYSQVATIPYHEIEGLSPSTAPSHTGELTLLSNGDHSVALCAGRHHLYEGYTAQQVCTLVYLLRALGATQLVITNAAGALNPNFTPGDVMLIIDHINFTGHNPLIGQDDALGPRFPDMSQAYPPALINRAISLAEGAAIECHQGVYIGVTGPSLETSAERRMFRLLGADVVGMSTVLEVIAANHCGLDVLGMSAITNLALGDENQTPDTLEAVLTNAAIAGQKIAKIVNRLFN